jgi:hypothetical protein
MDQTPEPFEPCRDTAMLPASLDLAKSIEFIRYQRGGGKMTTNTGRLAV